jgi:hypothetical protein
MIMIWIHVLILPIISQKLKERLSVLEKSRLSDENKRSWTMVMIPEFMSSESICSDTDDDILIKRQLPWRSQKVTDFFYWTATVPIISLLGLSVK